MCVLHRCDRPACCNPDHLFLGTKADNNADMIAKGRDRQRPLLGESNPQAKLTREQVIEILASGESAAALARRFGVSASTAKDVRAGKTWRTP